MFNLPLDHIGLHCSDVEENAKWYQEKLGFKVVGKFPGKGGHNVYFLENPSDGKMYEISQRDQLPGGATTRVDHIAYRSENLEKDYVYCKESGKKKDQFLKRNRRKDRKIVSKNRSRYS